MELLYDTCLALLIGTGTLTILFLCLMIIGGVIKDLLR